MKTLLDSAAPMMFHDGGQLKTSSVGGLSVEDQTGGHF
jgi:hypothetical protein